MAKKKKIPPKLQPWIDARKKYHLSHAQVQMARQLGLNPKKFGKLVNHRQEPWKLPLPQYIEELYFKRFGNNRPENVSSIEEQLKEKERKKKERQAPRREQCASKAKETDDKASPALQAAMLDAVNNQLRERNPPEAKQTYDRLIAEGYSDKEACRLIAVALSSEMYDILKHNQEYDRERYVSILHKLPEMPWE